MIYINYSYDITQFIGLPRKLSLRINTNSMIDKKLVEKYNYQVPRYTSYPTVPDWDKEVPTQSQWLKTLLNNYNPSEGLSIYIHLPFCENLCTYCGCNKRITKNHSYEIPYIRAVLEEWRLYRQQFNDKPKLKELHLGGGTPTFFSPANLAFLLGSILDDCIVPQDCEMSFEAHPNSTTREHLETLRTLGFNRLSLGVQDISSMILEAINRRQTVEDVRRVTLEARRLGYESINYDLIYGLPFQDLNHIKDNMAFIEELMPDRIAFYSYAHVPWKSPSQRAFTIDNVPKGLTKLNLFLEGYNTLTALGYEPIGMDHFCLPTDKLFQSLNDRTLHRNFMGYTASYSSISIGLGMSSISDAWGMYAQNEKSLESYQERIANSELPIIKGHRLTYSEKIMRESILKLMCQGELSWSDNDPLYELIKDQLLQMQQFEKDQLIMISDCSIKVTDLGQFFIRNICAAIDPFQFTLESQQKFSSAI